MGEEPISKYQNFHKEHTVPTQPFMYLIFSTRLSIDNFRAYIYSQHDFERLFFSSALSYSGKGKHLHVRMTEQHNVWLWAEAWM